MRFYFRPYYQGKESLLMNDDNNLSGKLPTDKVYLTIGILSVNRHVVGISYIKGDEGDCAAA